MDAESVNASITKQTRYTLGQFMNLNHGNVKMPHSLDQLFSNYRMPPCCLTKPYSNPHNAPFSKAFDEKNQGRVGAKVRKTVAANTDERIIPDMRSAFSSVVKGRDGTILCTAKINQMLIPHSMVHQIAELFFSTMIRSPRQIEEYIKVLFSIRRDDNIEKKIQLDFCKLVLEAFKTPVKLADTKISDGTTLTRQHREATCHTLAMLYAFNYDFDKSTNLSGPKKIFSSRQKLKEKLLDPLFAIIMNPDARDIKWIYDNMKCLAISLEIIVNSKKYSGIIDEYQERINSIYNNKKFKLTPRLALEDFVTY